jgi:hypothetical protein
MKKISDIYGIVRESRERIIKIMQERGITELATILPYSEWCKQEECEPEEEEDDAYIDYKDQEAPYVVFIGKYDMNDYRIEKVTLVGDRFKFEGNSNELGYDWAWEDDTVWATRMFVWEKLEELLGIGEEPQKVKCAVVFGTRATHRYDEQDFEGLHEVCRDGDGSIVIREFDTEAERRAYIMGIDDSDGWLGAAVLSKEDAECETVKQLLDD